MQLYIKNKFFSFGGDSYVFDENGNGIYYVDGKVMSLSREKTVRDMDGKIYYVVRNKLFSPFASTVYIEDAFGSPVAALSRDFLSFRHRYHVEGYRDQIVLDGSLFSFTGRLTIYRNGTPIGTIRNVLFDFVDSFLLETDCREDMPFLIALVIAHDNIHDKSDQ